jgi:hypothetical protein
MRVRVRVYLTMSLRVCMRVVWLCLRSSRVTLWASVRWAWIQGVVVCLATPLVVSTNESYTDSAMHEMLAMNPHNSSFFQHFLLIDMCKGI